jgi:subtilase family protein
MGRFVPRVLAGWLLAMLLAGTGPVWGQAPPSSKLTHDLLRLEREYAALSGAVGAVQASATFRPSSPVLRVAGGLVAVDAAADGDTATLLADLRALGLQDGKAFGRMVSGRLPIVAISAMGALPSLRFARPVLAATRVGTVTSQGDAAMQSDLARPTFGVTGSGVLVGTLSDSYNCLGGAPGDVASNDLPPGVLVVQEISSCTGATDEGRAIMQLIHDVAPGAPQAFHTAFDGMASFAQGIIDLANAGARVIIDDVIYFFEPMFQDGIVAQAVDTVAARGVAYFSAAGNEARRSYEDGFRPGAIFAPGAFPSVPGAPAFRGGQTHDFDPGAGEDHFQHITVPGLTSVSIAFQWDQPFFSVSGPPGSASDYDIYLFDDPPTTILDASTASNVGADPAEVISVVNTGLAPVAANIMIVKVAGPSAGKLKYVINPRTVTIDEFATNSSTIWGHANAAGAMAVGAAFWANTPPFGVTPPVLEPFSSAGGTPILFQTNGTPTLVTRQKPEIVAPDGGNTTFFGQDIGADPDTFPNFFGTSGSAPHAAGVGALMWQRNPGLGPPAMRSLLETTAVDMGTAGFDFDTGFGLVQAAAALAGVPATPPVPAAKTFTLQPCRLVDTRVAAVPGPVAAGSTIHRRVRAPLTGQGGAADCGVPATAIGVFVNVVAVVASGPGHLTVFPFGSPAPVASNLNVSTGQTVAGSAVIPLCNPSVFCSFDISVLMGPATAHLVIDVTGYLSP